MPIRIGCIGTARRAAGHLDSLSSIEDVEIAALCDIAEQTAQKAAAEHGGRPYTDYREMLDQEELDAVYIVTPPAVHAQQAIAAAQHGLHIFLEKPVALSMSDAMEMLRAVEEKGVLCSVGYQLRYSQLADAVVERLANRPIAMIAGHYYWTVPPLRWVMDKSQTGGQIVEQATHLVDLCRYFAGDIATVYARYALRTRLHVEGFNNWDANCLTFEFENGAIGSLVSTYALFPGISRCSGLDVVADELLVRYSIHDVEFAAPEGTQAVQADADPTLPANEAFIRAVQTRDQAAIRSPLKDAVRTLAVTLAANQSAQTGQPIDVETFLADLR